jgi:hypothetical protein
MAVPYESPKFPSRLPNGLLKQVVKEFQSRESMLDAADKPATIRFKARHTKFLAEGDTYDVEQKNLPPSTFLISAQ